jgi:GxxExxY protein
MMLYEQDLSDTIISAAIEVHRTIGPGLLESAYHACLAREFVIRELPFKQELALPLEYKGVRVECGYRLDFLVAGKIVTELKAVDMLIPVHQAQLITYMKLTGCRIGLLINFNVPILKNGLKRMVL